MALTIKNIAQRAEVSTATVSLALKDDLRIAEKTRKKIKDLAAKLGYIPSNLGRALQSSKSRLVGYLLSDVTASFYSEILQGIGEVATANGYGLLVAITDGSAENKADQLRLFRGKCIDGILVSNYDTESKRRLMEFEVAGIPVVVCSGDSLGRRIPNIIINNKKGGVMAAEHLIKLGHRRLAYCFAMNDNCSRYQGCVAAAKRNGLAPPLRCETKEDLRETLMSGRRPTGIIAFSDLCAVEVKHVAESVGLKIPEGLSVVGFDDIWFASLPEFNFTTIAQPRKEIGRLSMEMLLRRINGERVRGKRLDPTLVVRESTAATGKSS